MKHQNKYAQLVEAQSPEPQTAADDDDDDEIRIQDDPDGLDRSHRVRPQEASSRKAELPTGSDGKRPVVAAEEEEERLSSYQDCAENNNNNINNNNNNNRSSDEHSPTRGSSSSDQINKPKNRRASSQLSLDGQAEASYSGGAGSQVGGGSSSQISTCFLSTTDSGRRSPPPPPVTTEVPASNGVNGNGHHKQAATKTKKPNLRRTISRSMLELDQSHRLDNFEVSWRNLSFSYGAKWTRRLKATGGCQGKQPLVLDNISGKFQSNQLVAIIGPSGCGKTTLLQFLAGNNPVHKDRLRIVGLDEPKVAFIGQDDCLLPGLTAKETLIYASRLQNSRPHFDHHKHILPIMDELGLTECANRSVTKLSGGQAKRVTIAQEMLYPTNLLILDEVTSGLDASTSYSIIKLLKRLVSDQTYPMSIVMSIHQPSARLFAIFDKVYVMSEGCCLYEGSCNIQTVNSYLGRFGLECPKFHNIADYLIEVASESEPSMLTDPQEQTDAGEQRNQQHKQLVKEQMINYQRKQVRQDNFENGGEAENLSRHHREEEEEEQHQMVLMTAARQGGDDLKVPAEEVRLNGDAYAINLEPNSHPKATSGSSSSLYEAIEKARNSRLRPLYNQFLIHLTRSSLRIRRSAILTYLQLVTYILLGLQLSTFYGSEIGQLSGCPQLPMSFIAFVFSNDPTSDNGALEMRRIQENMNFLLVAIMTATFAALEITVITFPMEAKTVKREWRNGWYRVSSYFMGRTLADLPFQLVFVVVFCVVIYTLTGQIGLLTWRFGSFVTIIVMAALIAQTVGFIFGAIFMDNLPAAVFTAPLCIFPALLFSGFFSRASQVPSFYKPLTFLSHFRYAFDALLVTLYGYNRCACDQTVLTSYHDNLKNQTITIKEMFRSLFGAVDCGSSNISPGENSIEDTTTMTSHEDDFLNMLANATTTTPSTTTSLPFAMTKLMQTIKPVEDALVDRVFEHMSNASEPPEFKGNAMDRLTQKFSTRITTMLNSQANFGHEVPARCQDFNSYLMTEFDLHNDDLIMGLLMLFVFVILTRLICNFILTFTIARRSR